MEGRAIGLLRAFEQNPNVLERQRCCCTLERNKRLDRRSRACPGTKIGVPRDARSTTCWCLLLGPAGTGVWAIIFPTHTAIYTVFMGRMIIVLIALGTDVCFSEVSASSAITITNAPRASCPPCLSADF